MHSQTNPFRYTPWRSCKVLKGPSPGLESQTTSEKSRALLWSLPSIHSRGLQGTTARSSFVVLHLSRRQCLPISIYTHTRFRTTTAYMWVSAAQSVARISSLESPDESAHGKTARVPSSLCVESALLPMHALFHPGTCAPLLPGKHLMMGFPYCTRREMTTVCLRK